MRAILLLLFSLLVIFSSFSLSIHLWASPSTCNASTPDALTFLKGCGQDSGGITSGTSTTGITDISEKAKNYAEIFITLGSLFAIGVIVWAGIQYNTSFGDDTKVKNAKFTIIYAIVGLILLMASFPLVNMVIRFIFELAN